MLEVNHYRGLYATQRKLLDKEDPKRVKPLLYAYRVLMAGIRLLCSGEMETNLLRLNEHFRLTFLDELITRKFSGENTAVGDLGVVGLCTGGRARIRGRVIEFYGGGVKWLLQRFPQRQFTLAFTLGHTILGQTDASLDISREHELIHVRQFERWGLLMGPAYVGCSLVLWLMHRRPYRDNPFEREAYEQEGDE